MIKTPGRKKNEKNKTVAREKEQPKKHRFTRNLGKKKMLKEQRV